MFRHQVSPFFFSCPHGWPKYDTTDPMFSLDSPYFTPRERACVDVPQSDAELERPYTDIATERGNCGKNEREAVFI